MTKEKDMSGKKELTLYIGIRWHRAASRLIASKTENLLEKLTKVGLEKTVPLHWNFPITPYLENKNPHLNKLITEIKTRITACRDSIIPMGYSGAAYPFLEKFELEKELTLSISNPWKHGIKDLFKQEPCILIPFIPDIVRKESFKIYRKTGFQLMGIPFDNSINGSYDFGPWQAHTSFTLFTYQHISHSKKDSKSFPLPRLHKHISHLFILFDLHTTETDLILEEIIQTLSKSFHIQFASLKEKTIKSAKKMESGNLSYNPPLPCNPRARIYLKNAAALTAKNSRTEKDIQNTLKLISFNNTDLTSNKIESLNTSGGKSFLKPKIISAHMPGQVTLPGTDFDVTFSGGKLYSILKNGKKYVKEEVQDSLIQTEKRSYKYSVESVFSFEDESSRGLMEKLSCDLPHMSRASTIIREYFYVGDFPYLLITMEASYPQISELHRITKFIPFGIALSSFHKNDVPVLHSLYTDGSGYHIELCDHSAVYNMTGSMFFLPLHDSYLVFGFVPHKNPPVQSIQLRMEQKNHEHYPYVSFYGTYNREETIYYANTREVFSLFIGIKDQAPKKMPFFPQSVLKKIPAYDIAHLTL